MTERALELRLGAVAYPLASVEAEIVRDWLHGTRSLAAQRLSATVTEKLGADAGRSLVLGLDDIAALRNALCAAT